MSNPIGNEESKAVSTREEQLRAEIEQIMSLEYIAKHMQIIDEMDEEGYLPIEKILTYPNIIEFKSTLVEITRILSKMEQFSLSIDQSSFRLSIPIERKTIIIRETQDDVSEEDIRSLVVGYNATIRKEIGNTWFITFDNESLALECTKVLQSKELRGEKLKVRVKSEFYKKELIRRLAPFQTEEQPKRKLSSAAMPFIPSSPFIWGSVGVQGVDFGYSQPAFIPPSIPIVITSSEKKGYGEEFTRYSQDELYSIVRELKDFSLPSLPSGLEDCEVITKEANCELTEKGRTMSIDQALRGGAPRTFSIDSVDYTNMVEGYMGDEVTTHLKKQRKQHKHQKQHKHK